MSKRKTPRPRMSADAYAGFIRLLLTPLHREPKPSRDLDAYLRFLAAADRFEKASEVDHGQAA